MNGYLLIDKPQGISSFDVIRKVRKKIDQRKMGHSGTLDPLATGLMLLAIGEGTKLLEYLIGCDKEYEVLAEFGMISDTYDADGELSVADREFVAAEADIEGKIKECFLGEIEQLPPKYSALKINGKRACDLVRAGEKVEMKSRKIKVHDFSVLDYEWPLVRFKVSCGSGTYIRSLVNDLGAEFGCGAYVKELRRTKVSEFSVADACLLEDLEVGKVKSLGALVDSFKKRELLEEEFQVLRNGGMINADFDLKENPTFAFFKSKLVGVLEEHDSGLIKFRKQILQ